ncbi:MAG: ABC transporter permease, partial [Lachnospiraceae bacterium]|nr:ABC transporter permease [Lachnospiraceae bacterium]
GLIGAVLPLFLLAIIYHQLIQWLSNRFSILSDWMVFMSLRTELSVLVPFSLALGVGIGLLGSGLTVKRHLKV